MTEIEANADVMHDPGAFRLFADMVPDIVCISGPDGSCEYANRQWYDYTGCTPEQTIGWSWTSVIHPEDKVRSSEWWHEAYISGQHPPLEYRFRGRDGIYHWFLRHIRPVKDAAGATIRWFGVCTNIDRQKRTEQELSERESAYRLLADTMHDIVCLHDLEGRFLCASPSLTRVAGYSQEEIIGSDSYSLMHPDDRERVYTQGHIKALNGELPLIEWRMRRKDGTYVWLETRTNMAYDEEGCPYRLICCSRDITERKQAERDLRKSEKLYRTLIRHFPNGAVCLFDHNLRHTLADGSQLSELSIPRSTIAGRTIWEAFPPDIAALCEPHYRAALGGTASQFVVSYGERVYEVQTYPVRDENGLIFAGMVMTQDITARRTAEIEREQLLADALDRADHDPLTGLLNHRAFHKRLHEEADRARRQQGTLAVAVMDMDNFKFFNDVYGHQAGDDVLCRVAMVLGENCRSYDVAARFGGDEFALLMPGIGRTEALQILERLTNSLENLGYCPPGYDMAIPLALSIGVAIYPDEGETPVETLAQADARLRAAKSGGWEDQTERLRASLSHSVDGFSTLDAMVTAVDNKDRYTRRHSEDVLTYSLQIAQELGLDEAIQHTVVVAALLHDVGKIGVPDSILRKPGQLTEAEYSAIKQHPVMGAVMVSAVPGLELTLDAVRYHHERWDGRGYPEGREGEETPLLARLMAVADAFSAMTSDRPYRKGVTRRDALAVLEAGAGSQWDPVCVTAFIRGYHAAFSAASATNEAAINISGADPTPA